MKLSLITVITVLVVGVLGCGGNYTKNATPTPTPVYTHYKVVYNVRGISGSYTCEPKAEAERRSQTIDDAENSTAYIVPCKEYK